MHKLMIIGEAWGKQEEEEGRPFVGAAGYMLTQLLAQNGIKRDECYLTNVFNFKIDSIKSLCGSKAEAIPGRPKHSDGYIRAEFAPELARLTTEITTVRPNLILALGSTAAWFLCDDPRISKIRGSVIRTRYGKVLPTYHPAAVLREYSLRPILTVDIEKAALEQEFPNVRYTQRYIYIEPTYEDILSFYKTQIAPSEFLSVDVETISNQITCVGLAPSPRHALVIPFYSPSEPGGNYWKTAEEEIRVWRFLQRLFREPRKIVGQNFLYDTRFFWRTYGIPILGMEDGDDTMLMHHALQPEMQKGLAFLGSIYANEAPWKLERKTDTIKKED